jgi:hypothetical protein
LGVTSDEKDKIQRILTNFAVIDNQIDFTGTAIILEDTIDIL